MRMNEKEFSPSPHNITTFFVSKHIGQPDRELDISSPSLFPSPSLYLLLFRRSPTRPFAKRQSPNYLETPMSCSTLEDCLVLRIQTLPWMVMILEASRKPTGTCATQ